MLLEWKKEKLTFVGEEDRFAYSICLSGEDYLRIQVVQNAEGFWIWEAFGKRSPKVYSRPEDAKKAALIMAKMMIGEALHNLGLSRQ